MSVWSGIAAVGVAIALAILAVGQPVWEWRLDGPQQLEVWSYGPFSAHHTILNHTTNVTEESRDYPYGQLAPSQRNMASVFGEFGQFFALGLLAAFLGLILAILSVWKKLRGIFAGIALLAGCGLILYAAFAIVFTVPGAASATPGLNQLGLGIADFRGQAADPATGRLMGWTPAWGWAFTIGAGLGLAWGSSDLWHIAPSKKLTPARIEATVRRISPAPAPPPPPVNGEAFPPEPVIEEVFVIGQNGLLIKHMSRSLMSDKDRDVVGSMISAISSFVREAFSERDGEVQEVSLGDHRFVMCNESGLVVAVLVRSGQTEDLVHRVRHLLAILNERYGDRLRTWQGEPLEGIEDELEVLWEPYHLPPPPAV